MCIRDRGMGQAVADKKLIDVAQQELSLIAGQKAVQTKSRKEMCIRDRWTVCAVSSVWRSTRALRR